MSEAPGRGLEGSVLIQGPGQAVQGAELTARPVLLMSPQFPPQREPEGPGEQALASSQACCPLGPDLVCAVVSRSGSVTCPRRDHARGRPR